MEGQEKAKSFERGQDPEQQQQRQVGDQDVLRFLDSMDGYITLLDSVSSTLRQGWLELASARHSMGAWRVNSALLDLNSHSAATSVQVSKHNVDSMEGEPHFALCKWAASGNGEDKLLTKSDDSPQLRHRSNSLPSDKISGRNGTALAVDGQVQKERSKSLSVFGTLVSPKLRAAQVSFETALETLVEIANVRSSMLSSFDQVQRELEGTKG